MNYFEGITWINTGTAVHDPWWYEREYTNRYGICFVHSGPFELRLSNGSLQPLVGPLVLLYYPGIKYEYGITDSSLTWENRYINFAGPRVKDYMTTGLFPTTGSAPLFPISRPDSFLRAFEDLVSCINAPVVDDEVAVHKLEGLLLQLHRQPKVSEHSDAISRKMWDLHNEIIHAPHLAWDFEGEARKAGLSYSHFRKMFKMIVGDSPHQAVLNCRLRYATRLLLQTNYTMADIAERAGFSDQPYFIRLFKKRFLMPPGKYRREFR